MAEQRLPAVNGDDGAWGDILNQYLTKEHYNTGADDVANGNHKTITIRPGTNASGTAPLKFTSGTNLTATEAGAIEYNGTHLYFTATDAGTRYQLDQQSNALNSITAATTTATIANGNNPILWNWAQTTNTQNAFTFGETTAATNGTAGNQYALAIKTLASSTAAPLQVVAQGNTIIDTTAAGNITMTGLVGIGTTTTPVQALEVNGSVQIDTNLLVNGYIANSAISNFTGIGNSLNGITFGNGTIGSAFIFNDIAGAKEAIGTAGYNLTFYKHRSTDDTYYQTFQIVSGSGTAIGATGYKFNIGATTPVNIDSSGRLNLGVETAAYITPAQLNLVANASGALVPGINLVNKGGGSGAGMSINFSTWDGTGTTEPGARIRSSDNAYSADLVFTTKIPGSATNALVDRYKILSSGGTQTFGTAQVYHLAGGTSAPTLATGTGSGTGGTITATLSANTTDMAGQVNITTGTAPAASATVFTVTFNVAYGTAPIVILTPGNAITARLSAATNVYVSARSTTTFTITSNTTALTATTAYVWNYHVIQ